MESLSWSDTQKVKDISLENEAFSKNWPNYKERFKNNQSYYVSDFNWVKTWLKKQTRHKEILLPYAFIARTRKGGCNAAKAPCCNSKNCRRSSSTNPGQSN